MNTKRKSNIFHAIPLSALFLIFALFTTVQAEGPSYSSIEIVQEQIKFDYCQFVTCSNEGEGEWVNFTGTNTWVSTIERAGDHVIVSWKLEATKAQGEGLESGASYSAETAATEFSTMIFDTENEENHELAIKVNWSANISTGNNMLTFPLDFVGELRLDLDSKDMGFNYEAINTGCESSYTSNENN
jgi:hypothetical protein